MKKIILVALVVIYFVGFSAFAVAEELDADQARWSLLKKTSGFAAGFAVGLLTHEIGHQVMADLNNVSLTWEKTKWTLYSDKRSTVKQITLGGFGAEILSAEAMLFFDEIPKDNAFILGYLGYHIFNTLSYVLIDQLSANGAGDFQALRNTGGMSRSDVNLLQIGLVAHAIFTAYRVFENPKVKLYVNATSKEIVVGLSWQW